MCLLSLLFGKTKVADIHLHLHDTGLNKYKSLLVLIAYNRSVFINRRNKYIVTRFKCTRKFVIIILLLLHYRISIVVHIVKALFTESLSV